MREIKFRGLNVSTHQWVYGCLVNNLWTFSSATDKEGRPVCEIVVAGEAEDWSQAEDELIITVDESTVGQFTGLTDKNGKEIYEGDILRLWNRRGASLPHNYTVTYRGSSFSIKSIIAEGEESLGLPLNESGPFYKSIEVIGNIYESPHRAKDNQKEEGV